MRTDFYFDPACPWSWITSRWLTEVAEVRDLEVRWRPFSLFIKNYVMTEPTDYYVGARQGIEFTHSLIRVIEAVRAELGDDPVGALYTEMGYRIHNNKNRDFTPHDILEAAGIDTKYAAAATDESWDEVITASMHDLFAITGEDIGVPSIVFERSEGFFGPVISPAPTGEAALALFDSMYTMAMTPGFWELKRGRTNPPMFADRP